MAVLNAIASWELFVLLAQFLLGNSYLLLPADPAACCSDLLYPRVALLTGCLLLTTVAAASILLSVLTAVNPALQANADKQGVATGWKKLRVLLLLAIGLSAVSTFLAVPTFEAGYGYRKGCICSRDPLAVVAMVIMAIEHGCAAFLAAVAQD